MNFSSIIAAGIMGLATIASQSEAFQVRFKPVAEHRQSLAGSVMPSQFQGLEISRILFTEGRATGFAELKPRANTEFRRGEPLNIYFEPNNLATRFDGTHILASMNVDLLVQNEVGEVVVSKPAAWTIPLAVESPLHQKLTSVYAAMSTTPIKLSAGRYRLTLRIHDDFGGTFLDRHTIITVHEAQASR